MPLNIDILQILLHMFNFLILAGGLVFLLFSPVNKFLEERKAHFEAEENKIKADSEENERMRTEYDAKLKAADAEIAKMLADAEKEMTEVSNATINHAKEKAGRILINAEREAEDVKEHILESAQTEIGELVVTATHKLLSNTVTPERNSDLYDEFIRLAEKSVADKRASK